MLQRNEMFTMLIDVMQNIFRKDKEKGILQMDKRPKLPLINFNLHSL